VDPAGSGGRENFAMSRVANRLTRQGLSLRLLAMLAAMLVAPHPAAGWTGRPTPLDDHHLALVRPADFRTLAGETAELARCPQATFGATALPLGAGGAAAGVEVAAAGEYDVWIRVGQLKGPPAAIEAVLGPEENPLLKATCNDGLGDADRGGPNGHSTYASRARERSPDGRAIGAEGGKLSEEADDFLLELGGAAAAADLFEHAARIEEVDPRLAMHWWRLGKAKLPAGTHRLALRPAAGGKGGSAPLVDTVMLTTSPHIRYPFRGDIDAPRECYVRFRLDGPFASGQELAIDATILHHRYPGYWGRASFTPDGVKDGRDGGGVHHAAGFTRWYSLQQIEDVPAVGGYPASLSLSVHGSAGRGGATQFAMFPHADFVVREIPWDEPDGTRISLVLDFERYLDRLRTFRDHARDNYLMAKKTTGGQVLSLTRGNLLFGSNGATGEASRDYELKTLRLLGLNLVSAADPAANCRRYGWRSPVNHHAPEWAPFDPPANVARYDDFYRQELEQPRYAEALPTAAVMQIADEPVEAARSTISAPLWRWRDKAPETGAWVDLAGSGEMRTRRVDYAGCVLEGRISKQGVWVGFRAAVPDFTSLARQAYWRVGRVKLHHEFNLEAGRDHERSAFLVRPAAVVGNRPTPFKIVHDGDRAALFLDGKMVLQQDGVAPAGGFAIYGDTKTVYELGIRPLNRDESLRPPGARALGDTVDDSLDAELDDVFGGDPAAEDPSTKLGLQAWVERDWSFTGGIPEAHAGFRRWLETQGVEPGLFGCGSWADVWPLSIASAVETPADRRRYYWARRYTGMLTPLMFRQTAEAIHANSGNPAIRGFVALSGHTLYFPSQMPVDMFALGAAGPRLIPGISDWMSYGKTRWDSHQAVAFSVAPFHSGGRDAGADRAFPMMHCVHPSAFRASTMLANDVKYLSFYDYGPKYSMTVGYWSDDQPSYAAVDSAANRAAQVDDILAAGSVRRSRVGLLYARSSEYWDGPRSFADKRAAFLVLSHEGYQPELVTEEQVVAGRLADYDALLVFEPWVRADAAATITAWVDAGGLLVAAADAMTHNEFDEPADPLAAACGLQREFRDKPAEGPARRFAPAPGGPAFRPHDVSPAARVAAVTWLGSRVLGRYGDDVAGLLDRPQGKGRVVYFGHRPGLTATAQAVRVGGHEAIWADAGRDVLVRPLVEAGVERELILSEPVVMAHPVSTDAGTVIVMHNMRPASFEALGVSLREPAAPHSVQRFAGNDLVDQPWDYRDGRLHMSLPLAEDEPQMIVVRRRPAPSDTREGEIRRRCDEMLASTDPHDRSAAIWFAGFRPEWQAAARLRPLLADARWEVRRAAAEALGQLGDAESAGAIRTALGRETDPHVRVEMLSALSAVGEPQLVSLGIEHASDPHPLVRQAGLAAIAAGLRTSEGSVAADATRTLVELAAAAIGDRNVRIRTAGLDLLGLLEPEDVDLVLAKTGDAGALAQAAVAAETPGPFVARLLQRYHREPAAVESSLASALASSAAVRAACPGWPDAVPMPLLLAVAERWADPVPAAAVATRLDEATDAARLRAIALVQRDPTLSLALLRRALAGQNLLGGLLPLVLEKTFDARLGNSLAEWEQWTNANAATISERQARRTRGGLVTPSTTIDNDTDRGTAPELEADRAGQAPPGAGGLAPD
jgi:hypothetical protein